MTFSPEAKSLTKKSPALARKIKLRAGMAAYEEYKRTGAVPPGLDQMPLKSEAQKVVAAVPTPHVEPATPLIHNEPKITHSSPIQAQIKPDDPPKASDFLRTLRPGDVVRDKSDQRIRIQKINPDGLRIADRRNGVRDLSWGQLEGMGLNFEEKKGEGRVPAARSMAELRSEAESLGIDTADLHTIRDLEVALGHHYAKDRGNSLDQIDPMLAADASKLQDFDAAEPWKSAELKQHFWNNPHIVAEEKLDGVRLKAHFTKEGVRTDSRRRDTKTRQFSEKSANFPHMLDLNIPDLEGTVLDGEGIIPAKSGVLPSGVKFHGSLAVTTAATNASPEVSKQIQDKFGPMQFWFFDILRHKGEDVSKKPYTERRKLLEEVLNKIHTARPHTKDLLHTTRVAEGEDKMKLYEEIVKSGGEGIIFKDKNHSYAEGKRPKAWQKLKKFQEVDAFVSGFVPGQKGNEGLVGALELSVNINGHTVPIAAVSQLTGQQRLDFTAPDGSLRSDLYGKVVTFRGQEMTKNGRFRHAVFVGFRDDKQQSDIDGYEVQDALAELRPELFKSSAQETAF